LFVVLLVHRCSFLFHFFLEWFNPSLIHSASTPTTQTTSATSCQSSSSRPHSTCFPLPLHTYPRASGRQTITNCQRWGGSLFCTWPGQRSVLCLGVGWWRRSGSARPVLCVCVCVCVCMFVCVSECVSE
jgi:hypothetical protein